MRRDKEIVGVAAGLQRRSATLRAVGSCWSRHMAVAPTEGTDTAAATAAVAAALLWVMEDVCRPDTQHACCAVCSIPRPTRAFSKARWSKQQEASSYNYDDTRVKILQPRRDSRTPQDTALAAVGMWVQTQDHRTTIQPRYTCSTSRTCTNLRSYAARLQIRWRKGTYRRVCRLVELWVLR